MIFLEPRLKLLYQYGLRSHGLNYEIYLNFNGSEISLVNKI